MTTGKLKEMNKLNEEIQKLKAFRKAFHESCMKGLIAYRIGIKEPATLSFESDSELCEIIDDHLERKLKETLKKFEEI